MSGEQYTRRIESTRKALTALKKDIQFRDDQVIRNQPTYTLDAQIRGQFTEIDSEIEGLRQMYQNFQKKAKELNIMQRDLDKRKQALDVNIEQKNKLKRMYDESFGRRIPNTRAAKQAENNQNFQKQTNNKNMTKQDLMLLKEKQEQKQDEAIDDLLGTVKQMKAGQGEIRKELVEQDGLLDNLEEGIDGNIEQMSKVKRNMMKLLQGSSYWCLVLVILLEVAGIICNLILWPKS